PVLRRRGSAPRFQRRATRGRDARSRAGRAAADFFPRRRTRPSPPTLLHRNFTMKRFLLPILAAFFIPVLALAQTDTERFERELEQIRRDNENRAQLNVPPQQRALIDYGGSLSPNYLSIDGPSLCNHALRQY